jgi:hypothetical protein
MRVLIPSFFGSQVALPRLSKLCRLWLVSKLLGSNKKAMMSD